MWHKQRARQRANLVVFQEFLHNGWVHDEITYVLTVLESNAKLMINHLNR